MKKDNHPTNEEVSNTQLSTSKKTKVITQPITVISQPILASKVKDEIVVLDGSLPIKKDEIMANNVQKNENDTSKTKTNYNGQVVACEENLSKSDCSKEFLSEQKQKTVDVEQKQKETPQVIKCEKAKKQRNLWPIKILFTTFVLAVAFSFVSEITASKSNLTVALLLLVLLVLISILFDGIGIAVTSCDLAPLNAMAAKKVPHTKTAIKLVKNAEKVNNICSDVIGDICGIISGACGVTIVVKIIEITKLNSASSAEMLITIFVSSLIAALTVGGKAFVKKIAIKNSREFVMFTAKVLGIFYHPRENKKAKKRKKK